MRLVQKFSLLYICPTRSDEIQSTVIKPAHALFAEQVKADSVSLFSDHIA